MTKMVPTHDGGHIQRYTEISWKFSAKPWRRHSHSIGQLTMQSICCPATICHMGGLQLIGVELSGIHTIAWIKITCSRGRIMDLNLKLPCHIDGSMSGYFLIMEDMSRDIGTAMKSQWKTDIMEVSNDDL